MMDDAFSNGFPFEWIDTNRILRPPGKDDKQAFSRPSDLDLPDLDEPEVLNLFGSEVRLEIPDLDLHGGGESGSRGLDEIPGNVTSGHAIPDVHASLSKPSVVDDLDVWRFDSDLIANDTERPFYSWETFEKKAPSNARSSNLLSEAGARIFDAAVPKTSYSNIPSGAISQTAAHTFLCNLALGRSSIFFQWDNAKQQFVRTLEDAPISGLSPACSETVFASIAECGTAFRLLRNSSASGGQDKRCCPAIVAFRCCVADILDALESILTESLPKSRSLLQLQQLLETPRQLLGVLRQLSDALVTEKVMTEEEAISVLADKVHSLASAGHPCCEVLQLILSRASATWLERLSNGLGISAVADSSRGAIGNIPQSGLGAILEDAEVNADRVLSFIDPEDFEVIRETRASIKLLREHAQGYQMMDTTATQSPLTQSEHRSLNPRAQPLDDDPSVVGQEADFLAWADSNAQEAYIADLDARINEHPIPSRSSSDSWRNAIANLLDSDSPHTTAEGISQKLLSHEFKHLRFDPLGKIRPALQLQHQEANTALLSYFFNDLRLRDQFSLQRQFHLFGNGAFVSRLSIALFSEETQSAERKRGTVPTGETMGLRLGTREGQRWPPASSELRLTLLGILNETYRPDTTATDKAAINSSNELPGNLSFSIRELPDEEIEKVVDASSIFALDFLRLSYQPSAPLDAIFTSSVMQAYDDIFRFLLKLLRLLHVTTKLRERVLLAQRLGAHHHVGSKAPTMTNDQMTRFSSEFHVFISTLFSYIMDIGIQAPWQEFMNAIATIELNFLLESSTTASADVPDATPTASPKSSTGTTTNTRTKTTSRTHHPSTDNPPMATLTTLQTLHNTCLYKIKTRLFLRNRDTKLRAALEGALAAVLRCNGVLEALLEDSDNDGEVSSTSRSDCEKGGTDPAQERRKFVVESNGFANATREFVKLIARRVEQAPKKSSSSTVGPDESWERDAEALGILSGRLRQPSVSRGADS